jgi:hypothetical protein
MANAKLLRDLVTTVEDPNLEVTLFAEANDIRRRARAIYDSMSYRPERTKYDPKAVRALAPAVAREILSVAEQYLHASSVAKQASFTRGIGDPGHGWGHWAWDYVHALLLSSDRELDARETELTVLSGTLHDLATAIMPRYGESGRVLRHAEVGALLVLRALQSGTQTLDDDDCVLVAHAVLEHTHYRAPATVTCRDGVKRITETSFDEIGGRPLYLPWTTRWIDRLSLVGPIMLARHYLTLHHDHEDFGGGFYGVKYANHMRPILRSDEEIRTAGGVRTIGEHYRMFADSQTNATPYGKHDKGLMVALRDFGVEQSREILAALERPAPVDVDVVMLAWNRFLVTNGEPSENGRLAVDALDRNFRWLPWEDKQAFASMFFAAMNAYLFKAEKTLSRLAEMDLPDSAFSFYPRTDVRDFIRPDESWASVIRKM